MENVNFTAWISGLTWFDMSRIKVINKVKVIPRSNCKCLTFYQQVGGGPLTERHSS